MTEATQALADSKTSEAINAAVVAKQADTGAIAANMLQVLEEFFSRGQQEKKFIDVGRIPFICKDVEGIHSALKDINENKVTKTDFLLLKQQSDLTNKIVLGAVAIILVAFLGGLTILVFK